MIAAVKIPVTVKIRAGWDENSINAPHITQLPNRLELKPYAFMVVRASRLIRAGELELD